MSIYQGILVEMNQMLRGRKEEEDLDDNEDVRMRNNSEKIPLC